MAAGLVAIPSLYMTVWACEIDFKHFEIETELVSHLSFAAASFVGGELASGAGLSTQWLALTTPQSR